MSRNKIAFIFLLISTFLFLQGCQDNIILPDTVNDSHTPRFLYPPKGIPCPGIPTVDYSGKTYHTVQIGRQCWLKENIDVGVMIPDSERARDNGIIEKYCYNDSTENCNIYGGLYLWNEAMQYVTTEGSQGICPAGWHIPKFSEYQKLIATVESDVNALIAVGHGEAANTSGFSALFAGCQYGRRYLDLSHQTYFWSSSSSEINSSDAYGMVLYVADLYYYRVSKRRGFSIRCIKD